MNRLRNIIGLIAVCATAAFFTGCDDDNNNNNNNGGNAPESLRGRTYNLTDAGGTSVVAFDANADNYTLTSSDTNNVPETGTFTANKAGEQYTVLLNGTGAQTNSTLTMTFTGAGAGTYTFDRPGQPLVSGNFAAAGGTTTDGSTTTTNGNTTTSTDGNTTTGGNGTSPAPANVPGVLNITLQQGGVVAPGTVSHVTFNGGNFTATGDQGQALGSGTYTYVPTGNNAHLVMTYGAGPDKDDYTLSFNPGNQGTFSGTQSAGTETKAASGIFSY